MRAQRLDSRFVGQFGEVVVDLVEQVLEHGRMHGFQLLAVEVVDGDLQMLAGCLEVDAVYADMKRSLSAHVAAIWEELARESTVRLEIAGKRWRPAQRWWGRGLNGKNMEIDLVALSLDGRSLLLGEVKWEQRTNVKEVIGKLKAGADNFPHVGDREVVLACWLRQDGGSYGKGEVVFVPEDVIPVIR